MNKEEFLKLVEAKYAEISALKEEPSFLDYEKCFEELWTELGQQVKQAEQEDSGKDRRQKRRAIPPSEDSF